MEYYMFSNAVLRFSHYLRLDDNLKEETLDSLYKESKTEIEIFAFCLMPNHYHLLVRQNVDGGISKFISRLQNSHAKYLNIKLKRNGALYQSPFKNTIIETNEQLIHVARYIHINPLTSYVIKDSSELKNYLWCSFGDYVNPTNRRFINKEQIMTQYSSKMDFASFTLDRVNYQRELSNIKHLILEDQTIIPRV